MQLLAICSAMAVSTSAAIGSQTVYNTLISWVNFKVGNPALLSHSAEAFAADLRVVMAAAFCTSLDKVAAGTLQRSNVVNWLHYSFSIQVRVRYSNRRSSPSQPECGIVNYMALQLAFESSRQCHDLVFAHDKDVATKWQLL